MRNIPRCKVPTFAASFVKRFSPSNTNRDNNGHYDSKKTTCLPPGLFQQRAFPLVTTTMQQATKQRQFLHSATIDKCTKETSTHSKSTISFKSERKVRTTRWKYKAHGQYIKHTSDFNRHECDKRTNGHRINTKAIVKRVNKRRPTIFSALLTMYILGALIPLAMTPDQTCMETLNKCGQQINKIRCWPPVQRLDVPRASSPIVCLALRTGSSPRQLQSWIPQGRNGFRFEDEHRYWWMMNVERENEAENPGVASPDNTEILGQCTKLHFQNITSYWDTQHYLHKLEVDFMFWQEHGSKAELKVAREAILYTNGWEAEIGALNPDKQGSSAGAAALARLPNRIAKVKVHNKPLQMYVDIGRTDVYCFTLNGGTAVYLYNIFAWHGSQQSEEERQNR